MHVAERAKKCALFLGVAEGDDFYPKGTGFVVTCEDHGRKWLHLVTAQHVIEAIQRVTDKVAIRYNLEGGGLGGAVAPVSDWRFHPNETEFIDVAVVPFNRGNLGIDYSYIPMETHSVTKKVIDDMNMDTGDDVFVTGLFASHIGQGKNVVIVRTGTIAAMPEEPVYTSSGYIDAYLIEGRSIGGLSGSPVFFQPAPLRVIDGEVRLTQGPAHYLLGLIHGHFDVKEIIDIVEDESKYAESNKLHSGIAIVVPVEKIMETINHPELKRWREEIAKKAMKESDAVPDIADDEVSGEEAQKKGDGYLKTLLNTPPEPHEEMKEKKKKG